MKLKNIAILGICVFISCKNGLKGSSTDHLPPKVMEKLLMDINLAESYCVMVKDSMHRGGTKNLDSLAAYYKTIFAHYNITEAQFTQNLEWYKNHPADLDTIYNEQLINLPKIQAAFKVKKDSTKP